MRYSLIVLLVLTFTAAASAAEGDFPGVEKLMSPEEFSAAGLDKLSSEERRALSAIIEIVETLRHLSPEGREAEVFFGVHPPAFVVTY